MRALDDPAAPEHLDVIELATRVPIRSVRQRLVGIAENGEPEERRVAALALGRAGEAQAAGLCSRCSTRSPKRPGSWR